MKLFKILNKIINKEITSNYTPQQNIFRTLTYREKQAVEVYDFRDISNFDPNNNVIITCEHASNEKHKYNFPPDQEKFLDTHWGYDIGAKYMGLELAEESRTFSIFSNYSRLIIDPNRSLISSTLIRKTVEKNVELEINKQENLDEEKRLENFYLPYYRILGEGLNFVKPKFALMIHSFTKQYEDQPERKFEVGVLYKSKGLFADMIESKYQKEGVNFRINEPYKPGDGTCHTLDCLETYNAPDWLTDVVMLEFRNDFCSDPSFRKRQSKMLAGIINELKNKQ